MPHERQFTRAAKRRTEWRGGPLDEVQTQTSGGKVAGNSMPMAGGETIVRIRGHFEMVLEATVGQDGVLGAFGMAIVTSDAAGAGVTALPGPSSDPDWEGWIFHKILNVHVLTANSAIRDAFDFDSKAMRKAGGGNTELMSMVELNEQGTSMTVDYYYNSRVLVMLP